MVNNGPGISFPIMVYNLTSHVDIGIRRWYRYLWSFSRAPIWWLKKKIYVGQDPDCIPFGSTWSLFGFLFFPSFKAKISGIPQNTDPSLGS